VRAALLCCLLLGCATVDPEKSIPTSFSGICGLKPIGKSEEGILYVAAHCESREVK